MSTEDGNYDLSGDGSSSNSFNYGNGQFILDPNSKEYEFVTNDPGVITYTDPVTGVVTASGGSGVGATGGGGGGTNWSSLAKSLLGKAGTPAGIASLATGLYGAMGGNKPSTPPGWRGVINPNALTATRTQLEQPEYKPYSGEAMMGRKRFSDTTYGPTPTINPAITPIAAPAVMPPAAAPAVMPPAPAPEPEIIPGSGMSAGGVAGLAHGGR